MRPKVLILGFLVAFAVVNLLTGDRSPTVWSDEVFFSDPAYHLAVGDGFASTVSPAEQPYGTFWVMNSPLHPMLLSGWIRLFGFSVFSVRSFNMMVIIVASFVLALAASRYARLQPPGRTLLFLLLALCGMGMTFSYRSARPECLGIFVGALIWLVLSWEKKGPRFLILAILGIVVPFTGLHLVLVIAIYGVAWTLAERGRFWDLVALGAGIGVGMGTLVTIYDHFHVLEDWKFCLLKHSSPRKGWMRMAGMLSTSYLQDLSLLAMVLAGMAGLWKLKFRVDPVVRNIFFAGAAIPFCLTMAGNYPLYYSWLAALPVSGAVVIIIGEAWLSFPWGVRVATAVLITSAIVIGLPARMGLVALEWNRRSYAPVESFLKSNLQKDDVVYAEYQAFYGCQYASRFYYPASTLKGDWTRQVNVLILNSEDDLGQAQTKLGGNWVKVGSLGPTSSSSRSSLLQNRGAKLYALVVWRRAISN